MPAPNDLPSDSGPCTTPGFDEVLCEYVDGTLDEDIRAIFDECLCADADLADEVESLREARALLAAHRCPCRAGQLKGGVYERLANELMRECEAQRSREPDASPSPRRVVVFYAASLAVALTVGLALGASLTTPADPDRRAVPTALAQPAPDRAPLPAHVPPVLQRSGAPLDAAR